MAFSGEFIGNPISTEDGEGELAYMLENASPGDKYLYNALIERYVTELYRLAFDLLQDESGAPVCADEIEQVLVGTFSKAIWDIETFRGQESVRSWLYSLAYKAASASRRRRFFRRLIARNSCRSDVVSVVETHQIAGEVEAGTWEAFEHLRRPERLALVLRYGHFMHLDEIRRVFGVNAEKAQRYLLSGRKRMIAEMDPKLKGRTNRTHKRVRDKMLATVDGVLDGNVSLSHDIQGHVQDCEACREFLDSLVGLDGVLGEWMARRLHTLEPHQEDLDRISQQVRGKAPARAGWSAALVRFSREIVILGLVFLFVFAISRYLSRQDTRSGIPLFSTIPEPTPTVFTALEDSPRLVQVPPTPESQGMGIIEYLAPDISRDGHWIVYSELSISFADGAGAFIGEVQLLNRDINIIEPLSLPGMQSTNDSLISSPGISANGRWIVFTSNVELNQDGEVQKCDPGTNPQTCSNVFVLDRETQEIQQISRAYDGGKSDGNSALPTVSSNGRWVVFWSSASNLTKGREDKCELTNRDGYCWDVYVHDLDNGVSEAVPIGRGFEAVNPTTFEPSNISDDGRWLEVTLNIDDRTGESLDQSNPIESYLVDMLTGAFEPLNISEDGIPGDGPSAQANITPDGQWVVFVSRASNLVSGDTNQQADVFVRNRITGEIERIQNPEGETQGGGRGEFFPYYAWGDEISISADGRYVAFPSIADDLVTSEIRTCSPNRFVPCSSIYVHDRIDGNTQLVFSSAGIASFYLMPEISGDGRWVTAVEYNVLCRTAPDCSAIWLYDLRDGHFTKLVGGEIAFEEDRSSVWQATSLRVESSSAVKSLAISPGGDTLAAGSNDGKVRLWHLAQDKSIGTIDAHTSPIASVAFSPDGDTLVSAAHDGLVNFYKMPHFELIRQLDGLSGAILSLTFTPNGGSLAVGAGGASWTWQIDGEVTNVLDFQRIPGGQVHDLAYSPDGKLMALGLSDGTLWLRRASDGELLRRLAGHQEKILAVDFSPDGSLLASGSADSNVNIWRIGRTSQGEIDAQRILTLQHLDWVNDLAFSPDGEVLAVASFGAGVRLWRMPSGELMPDVLGNNSFRALSLAFSPDGKTLVTGSSWGGIQIWRSVAP